MLNVKTIAEVNSIIKNRFGEIRLGCEQVPLENALGRVLGKAISATEYVPDFNRSTVDGYAVISSDVFGCSDAIPALLTLNGESKMGVHTDIQLEKGQCGYVPTGAEVPQGADAVVMLEFTDDLGDGSIAIYKPCAPGMNMIFRGDDVKPGETIIPAGHRLTAAEIGALAALGITDVPVVRPPRVAILSTGDELVPVNEPLTMGMIRDVNAPMLATAVRNIGGETQVFGIVKDEKAAIRDVVKKAIQGCDMLILTGGTSVGVKDAVSGIIEELGELIVHGVAVKPGKPTIFGAIQEKPVFGLPGNPVAAYFMFHVLVQPLLFSMQGTTPTEFKEVAPLAHSISSNHGREEFIPVQMKDGVAQPIAGKSGLITTLSCADGFICIPRDCEGLKQGEPVEVTYFRS
ncbi:MAG TPA: molybdopterin molybdenumtransferase MoeA [Anaerolineaceae bacterium]|nr:molybdopterin molybdenumtransferase MoeA [Anaerolineaceae bacterium]